MAGCPLPPVMQSRYYSGHKGLAKRRPNKPYTAYALQYVRLG
jgi:hypothetical protein